MADVIQLEERSKQKVNSWYCTQMQTSFSIKNDELLQLIAGNEPNIIITTEVIPKAQINPTEAPMLEIEGYDHYLNFEISNTNLGASGIRGVAISLKKILKLVR